MENTWTFLRNCTSISLTLNTKQKLVLTSTKLTESRNLFRTWKSDEKLSNQIVDEFKNGFLRFIDIDSHWHRFTELYSALSTCLPNFIRVFEFLFCDLVVSNCHFLLTRKIICRRCEFEFFPFLALFAN